MNKLIITIIVIALILIGGYYYLSNRTTAPESPEVIESVSVNDELPVLEEELDETPLEDLDSEFTAIEAEIEEALSELGL